MTDHDTRDRRAVLRVRGTYARLLDAARRGLPVLMPNAVGVGPPRSWPRWASAAVATTTSGHAATLGRSTATSAGSRRRHARGDLPRRVDGACDRRPRERLSDGLRRPFDELIASRRRLRSGDEPRHDLSSRARGSGAWTRASGGDRADRRLGHREPRRGHRRQLQATRRPGRRRSTRPAAPRSTDRHCRSRSTALVNVLLAARRLDLRRARRAAGVAADARSVGHLRLERPGLVATAARAARRRDRLPRARAGRPDGHRRRVACRPSSGRRARPIARCLADARRPLRATLRARVQAAGSRPWARGPRGWSPRRRGLLGRRVVVRVGRGHAGVADAVGALGWPGPAWPSRPLLDADVASRRPGRTRSTSYCVVAASCRRLLLGLGVGRRPPRPRSPRSRCPPSASSRRAARPRPPGCPPGSRSAGRGRAGELAVHPVLGSTASTPPGLGSPRLDLGLGLWPEVSCRHPVTHRCSLRKPNVEYAVTVPARSRLSTCSSCGHHRIGQRVQRAPAQLGALLRLDDPRLARPVTGR